MNSSPAIVQSLEDLVGKEKDYFMTYQENIHALFAPKTVAVIGASDKPGKVGHTVVHNMLDAEFKGTL